MDSLDKKFIDVLTEVSNCINSEELKDFSEAKEVLDSTLEDIRGLSDVKNTDRNLRIGIVGEVKAGKSSFLNALVFGGRDFLPKAATPMTAALTKICYAEQQKAVVHFFNQKAWDGIEENAKHYNDKIRKKYMEMNESWKKNFNESKQPEEMFKHINPKPTEIEAERKCKSLKIVTETEQSCKELYDMVQISDIAIYDYLGKSKELNGDVVKELQDYVGSNGKFTPIVEYTELFLNEEGMKGIEIIDTPGLNDPIVSRSKMTKDNLSKCDVVFSLSNTGSFFKEGDIKFLRENVSGVGIKKAVLVGTKLDSGILDYTKEPHCSFARAYQVSVQNYRNHAKDVLKKSLHEVGCPEVIKRMSDENIYFVSSHLYQAGMFLKNNKEYSDEVKFTISNLKKRFSEVEESPKYFFSMAGIHKINNDVLNPIKENKDKILGERVRDYTQNRVVQQIKKLDNLQDAVKQHLYELENFNVEDLDRKINGIEKVKRTTRISLKGVFEHSGVEIEKKLNKIRTQLGADVDRFNSFNSEKEISHKTSREGGFFGFFQHTVHKEITTYSANVSQVCMHILQFANQCDSVIQHEYNKIVNVEEIKNSVKQASLDVFRADDSMDENDVLIPLRSMLDKLTLPKFKISTKEYDDKILTKYSSNVVYNEEVYDLQQDQLKALLDILHETQDKLEKSNKEIQNALAVEGSTFMDKLLNRIEERLKLVKDELKDKQFNIDKYKEVIEKIDSLKTNLNVLHREIIK